MQHLMAALDRLRAMFFVIAILLITALAFWAIDAIHSYVQMNQPTPPPS